MSRSRWYVSGRMSRINGGEFFKFMRWCWHSFTTLSISLQVFSRVRLSVDIRGGVIASAKRPCSFWKIEPMWTARVRLLCPDDDILTYVRACMRAYVRACVRACVPAYESVCLLARVSMITTAKLFLLLAAREDKHTPAHFLPLSIPRSSLYSHLTPTWPRERGTYSRSSLEVNPHTLERSDPARRAYSSPQRDAATATTFPRSREYGLQRHRNPVRYRILLSPAGGTTNGGKSPKTTVRSPRTNSRGESTTLTTTTLTPWHGPYKRQNHAQMCRSAARM